MNKAVLKRALNENAASIALHMLGQPNAAMSSKLELRFGRKGSRSVAIAGAKQGYYYDHEAGIGGDLLFSSSTYGTLASRRRSPLPSGSSARRAPRASFRSVRRRSPMYTRTARTSGNACALALWRESVDLRGTPAEYYLATRGITVMPDGIGHVLRFHPNGCFGPGIRVPMLVALCRDIRTNEARAVHRTGLSAAGAKMVASTSDPRRAPR